MARDPEAVAGRAILSSALAGEELKTIVNELGVHGHAALRTLVEAGLVDEHGQLTRAAALVDQWSL